MAATIDSLPNSWNYSAVSLTLENILLPEDKLSPTPSFQDGVDEDTETDLRIYGCELIQTAGILLKLPQVAMATGQVIYQRFYYCKSFVNHNPEIVAMACINLAAKIEEAPRRIRDSINVFHHMKQVRLKGLLIPMLLDEKYVKLKNDVIKAERRLLKELGFCVHVKHPHKLIVMYMRILGQEENRKLVQKAWNYMNDSFRTNVFLRFHPETIAASCIYLAARQLRVALPNSPPWYLLIRGTNSSNIRLIAESILNLYVRPKNNPEKLEQTLATLKKVQSEAKARMRSSLGGGTPNTGDSRPQTPTKVSPYEDRHKEDKLVNGVKKRLRDRNRSRSISSSRSPPKRHRNLPSGYRIRSQSRSRSRTKKSKSKRRSSYSRSRSRERNGDYRSKKHRSRSGDRSRHRTTSKRQRSFSRDRYRR